MKNPKILIPIDFSTKSKGLVRNGLQLSRLLGKDIVLLHVLNLPDFGYSYNYFNRPVGGTVPEVPAQIMEERREQTQLLYKNFIDDLNLTKVEAEKIAFKYEAGFYTAVIEHEVSKDEFDFLMLKTGEQSGFLLKYFGGINEKIVEKSVRPVWIIPEDYQINRIERILYGTDFNEKDVPVLIRLAGIAKELQAEILLVHLGQEYKDAEYRAKKKIKEVVEKTGFEKLDFRNINEENPQEILPDFAGQINADVVSVLKRDRSFFEKIFESSTTNKLLGNISKPLIVFHE